MVFPASTLWDFVSIFFLFLTGRSENWSTTHSSQTHHIHTGKLFYFLLILLLSTALYISLLISLRRTLRRCRSSRRNVEERWRRHWAIVGRFLEAWKPLSFYHFFLYPRQGMGMPFASGEKEGRFLSSLWSSEGRLFLSPWSSQVSVVAGVVKT